MKGISNSTAADIIVIFSVDTSNEEGISVSMKLPGKTITGDFFIRMEEILIYVEKMLKIDEYKAVEVWFYYGELEKTTQGINNQNGLNLVDDLVESLRDPSKAEFSNCYARFMNWNTTKGSAIADRINDDMTSAFEKFETEVDENGDDIIEEDETIWVACV